MNVTLKLPDDTVREARHLAIDEKPPSRRWLPRCRMSDSVEDSLIAATAKVHNFTVAPASPPAPPPAAWSLERRENACS